MTKYNFDYVSPSNRSVLHRLVEECRPQNRILSAESLTDAIIVPPPASGIEYGGVIRDDGTFVSSSAVYQEAGGLPSNLLSPNVPIMNGVYIYIGWFHNGWGHSFTDYIKKFWYLHTDDAKNYISQGCQLVYICSGNNKPNSNIIRMLSLCGVDIDKQIMVRETTRFETLIIPDDSFWGGVAGNKYYTPIYATQILRLKERIRLMVQNAQFERYEKIYFSRAAIQWNPPRDYCEKGIEKAFEKMGYKVIHPEKHSIEEQFHLLAHCDYFAATEGSVSHNAIFCRPGTNVIIVRKSDYVNRYQLILDEIADINVTYIDAHKTMQLWDGIEWYGPFFMHVSRYLKKFAVGGVKGKGCVSSTARTGRTIDGGIWHSAIARPSRSSRRLSTASAFT